MTHTPSLFDPPDDGGKPFVAPLEQSPESTPTPSTAPGARLTADHIAALPTQAPARRKGPQTSKDAARRIDGYALALRGRVLDYIASCGSTGATDREIQAALNLSSDTEVPRRWELVRAGLVIDSGTTRPTPSRRRAIVWVVKGVTA